MELTEDIIYVEESSFRTIPVAIKDILVMQFASERWRGDGRWATAYVYLRDTKEPLREPRLFWIDPFLDKQDLSKKSEKLIAGVFPESDFFQVALGEYFYLVIYGPEVNITEDQMIFKNQNDSNLIFHLDPETSSIIREAFMDWERRTVESRR